MQKSPIRLLQSLAAALALVLAHSSLLFGQEPSLASLTPSLNEPRPAEAVEVASAARAASPEEGSGVFAREISSSSTAAMEPTAFVAATAPPKESASHPFWDSKNRALFATAGSLAALDFYATHANLASGGKELNPVTRVFCGSTPMLAANFALETGSVIGISYLFHKTGHHKLERITALVNIGSSGAAAGYSLAHR